MQTATFRPPLWVYVLLLALGVGLAQGVIALGVSPYAVLGAGLMLLLFRRRVARFALRNGAKSVLWMIEAPWPGQTVARRLALRMSRAAAPAAPLAPPGAARAPERTYTAEEVRAFFDAHAEPCAVLALDLETDAPPDAFFGGLPRLRDPSDWPRGQNGAPLHFVMAVNLAAVPDVAHAQHLPKAGWLSLFLTMPDGQRPEHAVRYAPEFCPPCAAPDDLAPVPAPLRASWRAMGHFEDRIHPFTAARLVTLPKLPTEPEFSQRYPYSLLNAAHKEQVKLWIARAPRPVSLSGIADMYPEGGYDGAAFGGHFPWTVAVARHVLQRLIQQCRTQRRVYVPGSAPPKDAHALRRRLQGMAARRDNDRRAPDARQRAAQDHRAAEILILKCQSLARRLGMDAAAPLGPETLAAFDAIMGSLDSGLDAGPLSRTGYGVLKHLREVALKDDTLRAGIPGAFFTGFRPERVRPHAAQHMVGGPKDHSANPMDTAGVRLFQIDSDESLGLTFGDCGFIEVWIDPDDLNAGRYARTRISLSST